MTKPSQRDARRVEDIAHAAVDAARAAAVWIRSQARNLAEIDWREKARADFVSDVDVGAETRIVELLQRRFPDAVFIGEELTPTATPDAALAFLIDPLDGTTNFLHGYPQYAVSIAALADGELVAGVVLDVPRDSLILGTRGGGAQRDGHPMHVSTLGDPRRALVGTGFPFRQVDLLQTYLPQLARISREAAGARRAGAAALDLTDVASGRLDAFWELSLSSWDVAAALLILREAGGRVTDLEGRDARPVHGAFVASNGVLHDWFLHTLAAAAPGG